MDKPILCIDSFLNERMYPSHTLSASEEATGHEAWRVANGRRSGADHWTGTTLNTAHHVTVDCATIRAADFLGIDRGHNLAGKVLELRGSNDAFTTYETVFSWTVPSEHAAGRLSDGVYTEEGALLRSFDVQAFRYWRLYFAAVSGWKPELVGVWLGKMWEPDSYAVKPHDEDAVDLSWPGFTNRYGWQASSRVAAVRAGRLHVRLPDYQSKDHARRFLVEYRRRPAWYVPDPDDASTAFMVRAPQGTLSMPYASGWAYPQIELPYVEHETAGV